MIFYPRHTRMDVVDDTWKTENEYVVQSSTKFIISHLNDVGHVTQGELDGRHIRSMHCLGQ